MEMKRIFITKFLLQLAFGEIGELTDEILK